MSRACKLIGGALVIVGLAVALGFVRTIARDEEYRRAEMAASRNAGNVMYEAEFKGAQVRRAFEGIGAVAGVLLGLNGFTLIGLGVVAGRVPQRRVE